MQLFHTKRPHRGSVRVLSELRFDCPLQHALYQCDKHSNFQPPLPPAGFPGGCCHWRRCHHGWHGIRGHESRWFLGQEHDCHPERQPAGAQTNSTGCVWEEECACWLLLVHSGSKETVSMHWMEMQGLG